MSAVSNHRARVVSQPNHAHSHQQYTYRQQQTHRGDEELGYTRTNTQQRTHRNTYDTRHAPPSSLPAARSPIQTNNHHHQQQFYYNNHRLNASSIPASGNSPASALLQQGSNNLSPSSNVDARLNGIRALIAMLFFVAVVVLIAVSYDHFSFTQKVAVFCFSPEECKQEATNSNNNINNNNVVQTPKTETKSAHAQSNQTPTTQPQPSAEPPKATPVTASASVPVVPVVDPFTLPYYDQLSDLYICPPLIGILSANKVPVLDASTGDASTRYAEHPKAQELASKFHEQLNIRMSSTSLQFLDLKSNNNYPPLQTMQQWFDTHPNTSFITSSQRNYNYTISTWQNLCYTFHGEKDPHLILLGNQAEHQQLIDNTLYKQDHNQFAWLPPRYCNDQARLKAMQTPDPNWIYLPAVPDNKGLLSTKHDGAQTTADLLAGSFHQLQWDFNVGHQFHQQVLPMYQALHSHRSWHTPLIQSLLIDHGCASGESSLGVRHNAWKTINQFFARIVLEGVKERVRIVRQPCVDPITPSGICFERVSFNDAHDQYLDRGGVQSFATFRAFRTLILDTLQLNAPAYAGHALGIRAASAVPVRPAPLRVTIYTRHDSSRRRIMNIDALIAALSPYHIVRPIHTFGIREPIEQLALYAHTDILIAPHGAHMTFTFLLPSDAVVVECFAHEEGKFSWTINFLRATGKRHIIQVGIAHNATKAPVAGDYRNMDRDFDVDLQQLCQSFKALNIPIKYEC